MERKNNEKRTGRLSNLSEVFQLSKEGKTFFSNPSFRFWQLQNKWKNIAGPKRNRHFILPSPIPSG